MYMQHYSHNKLIINRFTPPYSHPAEIEGDFHITPFSSSLLRTAPVRVGRVLFFLLVACATLSLASCSKDPGHGSLEEHYDTNPIWGPNDSNQFWNKSTNTHNL
jgi:hypothetical protein